MVRYRLLVPARPIDPPNKPRAEVFITLDAGARDQDAELRFEGDPRWLEPLKERLFMSYGFRARMIEEVTSPMDLDAALKGEFMRPYQAELVSGEAVLKS